MPERGDLLLAERSTGGHRNVAEALQHDPPTQRSRLSSPGTAQLDHSCLDRRLPSPARSSLRPDCVRRPGSDDELAPLGLDSVLAGLLHLIRTRRKVLKDWPNQQAGRAILSLSDWYKTSGRSGRNQVFIGNSAEARQALVDRLRNLGCDVRTDNKTHWLSAGDFDAANV